MIDARLADFGQAYALQRAAEGRGYAIGELMQLPYLRSGPLSAQWAVRARTFDAFRARLAEPLAARLGRPLDVLDLGAGNGWLSYRMALAGHRTTALDIRTDAVDGLRAADILAAHTDGRMRCVRASFDAVPDADEAYDLAAFNASLHYATDLSAVLCEAHRVTRPAGLVAILDSPFYARERDGAAMVREKRANAPKQFGERAEVLMGMNFTEYLTPARLAAASAGLGLAWRRLRVRYPLAYELRPLVARLRRRRLPSRFDVWVAART